MCRKFTDQNGVAINNRCCGTMHLCQMQKKDLQSEIQVSRYCLFTLSSCSSWLASQSTRLLQFIGDCIVHIEAGLAMCQRRNHIPVIYEEHTISFLTFFLWKFSMLLLYILWDDWPIFMISGSNEQLQQEFEYTLLKHDSHSWWISKMQSDTLEERYAIKLCFKLGKDPTETYRMLHTVFGHLACIVNQFLSGIKDSRKAGSLWGMMRGVGGVSKSIHQSWLANGLGLGLLCWGFKGVQEEIRSEEASALQIGSVAFPPGQCTSPRLHPCHRLFDQDGHQNSYSPSL